jgi:hypothetical protein
VATLAVLRGSSTGDKVDDRVAGLERPRGRAVGDMSDEPGVVGQHVAQHGGSRLSIAAA